MLIRSVVLAFFSMVLGANAAWSDELADLKARNAQLQATVEELTLQLAESLSERKALEAELVAATAKLDASSAAAAAAIVASPAAEESVAEAPAAAESVSESAAVPAIEDEVVVEEAVLAEAGMAAAPVAKPAAAQDSGACDVSEALKGYKRSGKANRALGEWLEADNHLKLCSKEQLTVIRKAVKFDFLGYEKAVLAMIDEELEAR